MKKISQEALAFELNLNQSQYSRRESGEIAFSSDEIVKLAQIFSLKISEIFGEEAISFNTLSFSKDKTSGQTNDFTHVKDKLFEQFEMRIKEKEYIIELLQGKIMELERKNNQ